jgi:hypothetical protein
VESFYENVYVALSENVSSDMLRRVKVGFKIIGNGRINKMRYEGKHKTIYRQEQNSKQACGNDNTRYLLAYDELDRKGKALPQYTQLFPNRNSAEAAAKTMGISITNVYEVKVYFNEI